MKKILVLIFILTNVSSYACWFPLEVTTQAQVDSLAGVTFIDRCFIITTSPGQDSATMITDLSPLISLDSIDGFLRIQESALTNLKGLENLQRVTNIDILNNAHLVDASDLSGPLVTNTGVDIWSNPVLEILPNTKNWKKVDYFEMYNNTALKNVVIRYENQTEENGFSPSVTFESNPDLLSVKVYANSRIYGISLFANDKLKEVHIEVTSDTLNRLFFKENASLEKITGLTQIGFMGLARILDNSALSNLCVLQELISNDNLFLLEVNGNAQGANSESEILASDCSGFNTSVSELEILSSKLFPNPASQWVEVKGSTPSDNITLYTVSGQLVKTIPLTQSRFNVSDLPRGMYLVKTANEVHKLLVE